jgi:hypothetical protein
MTTHAPPDRDTSPLPPAPRKRRLLYSLAAVVGVIILLGGGVAIGAAANSHASELAAARSVQALQHRQIDTLTTQLGTARSQAATAQAQANSAVADANAKAASAYATRNAALDQRAAALKNREHAVAALAGEMQASKVTGDGVYVVGHDIKSGVYHTPGSSNTGQADCYYALLRSNTNTSDVSNIITNDNFDGPNTADISGAYAFEVSGVCTWYKVG